MQQSSLPKISFAHHLVQLILSGEKWKTYRYGDKYAYLNVGDKFMVTDSGTGRDVATGEIAGKSVMKFRDLPIEVAGHESYASKDEQREIFKGFYGKEIGDDEDILVLEFRLIEKI